MPRIHCLLVRLALLGGLVGVPVAHAQVATHAVPFVDLASGESLTAGAPVLQVAGNARQTAKLAKLADRPELGAQLAALTLSHRKVVGVFAGPMASSGHSVSVKGVLVGSRTVQITVDLIRPLPDQNVNDVISYPYAIVAIPASTLPRRATWRVISTEGKALIPPQRR